MDTPDYAALVARHRDCFLSGRTRPEAWRQAQLQALKALFDEHHDELCDALWKDLRRNGVDADLIDVANSAKEAEYALTHFVPGWRPSACTCRPAAAGPGRGAPRSLGRRPDHRRLELPVHALVLAPLVPAIAGRQHRRPEAVGAVASLLRMPWPVSCRSISTRDALLGRAEGGVPETTALLAQTVGLDLLHRQPGGRQDRDDQAAARHLTPCVLELGGKNPTIVHSSAEPARSPLAASPMAATSMPGTSARHRTTSSCCSDVATAVPRPARTRSVEFYGEDPQAEPRLWPDRQSTTTTTG